jgi:hypothetical protein
MDNRGYYDLNGSPDVPEKMTDLGILLEEANRIIDRRIKDRRVQVVKTDHPERRFTTMRKLILREGEY